MLKLSLETSPSVFLISAAKLRLPVGTPITVNCPQLKNPGFPEQLQFRLAGDRLLRSGLGTSIVEPSPSQLPTTSIVSPILNGPLVSTVRFILTAVSSSSPEIEGPWSASIEGRPPKRLS